MCFFDSFFRLSFSRQNLQTYGFFLPSTQRCLFYLFILEFSLKNCEELKKPEYCTNLSLRDPFFSNHPALYNYFEKGSYGLGKNFEFLGQSDSFMVHIFKVKPP